MFMLNTQKMHSFMQNYIITTITLILLKYKSYIFHISYKRCIIYIKDILFYFCATFSAHEFYMDIFFAIFALILLKFCDVGSL